MRARVSAKAETGTGAGARAEERVESGAGTRTGAGAAAVARPMVGAGAEASMETGISGGVEAGAGVGAGTGAQAGEVTTDISMLQESESYIYLTHPLKIILLVLPLVLVACSVCEKAPVSQADGILESLNSGYGILNTTLRDEQHLKIIRLTKSIVTFKSISKPTRQIIDDIAQTSSAAVEKLEQLASLSPLIELDTEKGGQVEQMTRDAIRITTAKEFLASKEDFELKLLISQSLALRYISHLAKELHAIETNSERRVWLAALSDHYEKLYLRVLSRLKVAFAIDYLHQRCKTAGVA
jgi:hypothetical protein